MLRLIFLLFLALPGASFAGEPSCAKSFSLFFRSPFSSEGRQWLAELDEYLVRHGKALEKAGVKINSGGKQKLRVWIPAQGYDAVLDYERLQFFNTLDVNSSSVANAWLELPEMERKLSANGMPLTPTDRFWAVEEILVEERLLSSINRNAAPLEMSMPVMEASSVASSVPKSGQEKIKELRDLLRAPGSQEELQKRTEKELSELTRISAYANEPWIKFVPTRVQDIQSEKLARLRLAMELEHLLKDKNVVIEEVYETGAKFNDKFSPNADQIRAFSEGLPVFRVRVLPGKAIPLSRSWGGKSGEFSNWLLPQERSFLHPGLLRERAATPNVNTHQFQTAFEFGEGEVFYLGGINPVRGEGPKLIKMAGDFNYGIGGRGGHVQYWRDPGLPRITESNVKARAKRVVSSPSLGSLQRKMQEAESISSLEALYENFLEQAEDRFLDPDLDTAAAIRDVPDGYLRAFLYDLKTIEDAAKNRAEKLGGKADSLLERAERLHQLVTKAFIQYHGRAAAKEYDPVNDSAVPLAHYEALRISEFLVD